MKKIILLGIIAMLTLSATAFAQDKESFIAFELRGTMSKASGAQAVSFRPTYAGILDLGRIDLGFAYTNKDEYDSTQNVELFAPIELFRLGLTHDIDGTKTRWLTFETYIGIDVVDGFSFQDRSVALGLIYGSERLNEYNLEVILRGQVKNYDWTREDGTTTSLNDWYAQLALRKGL